MTQTPEVYVIDDEAGVRRALAFSLQAADFTVRTFPSAEDFLAVEPSLPPGCLITDVRMPGMSGTELLRRLGPERRRWVIVITGRADIPMASEAIRAGAHEFLEKPLDPESLVETLRALIARQQSETVLKPTEAFSALTSRERDVLRGIVSGETNKAVGRRLGISPRTVEVYRAGLMRKSGAGSLPELVRMAIEARV